MKFSWVSIVLYCMRPFKKNVCCVVVVVADFAFHSMPLPLISCYTALCYFTILSIYLEEFLYTRNIHQRAEKNGLCETMRFLLC